MSPYNTLTLVLIALTAVEAQQSGPAEAQESSCATRLQAAGAEAISPTDVLACMLEMQTEIEVLRDRAVATIPDGAVVAFQSSTTQPCPGDDWTIFAGAEGRFIVGAGIPGEAGLTPRRVNETGGEETHTLSLLELPAHNHSLTLKTAEDDFGLMKGLDVRHKGRVFSDAGTGSHALTTGTNGGDIGGKATPHNNMPPYIALYFCKRESR